MKRKIRKQENGITLIALVITIIVLLILAGVAISMLSGENGILTRAGDAREQTKKTSTDEQIKLAAMDAMIAGEDLTEIEQVEHLNDALKKQGLNATATGDKQNGYLVKIDETEYEISANGVVKEKTILTQITGANYGDEIIGYSVLNGDYKVDNWKVFLNDGNNVWIIASDIVKVHSNVATRTKLSANNDKWTDTIWSEEPQNGKENVNANCAESLSNIENWKEYAKEGLAVKAMGAPTIEMFAESYNAKHPNRKIDYKFQDPNIDANFSSSWTCSGYSFRWNEQDNYSDNLSGLETDCSYLMGGFWLASPSVVMSSCLNAISLSGSISTPSIYNGAFVGIRPVVCLRNDISVSETEKDGKTAWEIK